MAENKIGQYDIYSKESLGTIKEVQGELLSTLEIMKLLADSGVKLQESLKKPQGLEDTAKATEKVVQNNNRLVETAKQLEAQQNKLIAAQARETASRTQANKEILRTNQATSENNKIAKLQAVLADENAGKLEKLRAANGLLRIQKEKLKETDENYVETIAKLNEEMDKNQAEIAATHNAEQKRTAGIGQYKEQMQGLIGDLKSGQIGAADFGKGMINAGKGMAKAFLANPVFLTIAALTGVFLAGKKVVAMVDETIAQRVKIKQLTDETGADLSRLSAKTVATANTFKVSFDDLAVAQNNFAQQMGITNEAANELINQGFLNGADASGEFLAMLREYGPQLKEAGYSAEEAINMMSMQVKAGVFTDKGIDVIKEASLRLREMPKATADALDAIGISSADMMDQLSSGQISVQDAIEQVSKQMAKLPPQSSQVGTAIADIFGGPGEDAGLQYILMLGDTQSEMEKLSEKTRDQMTAQELMLVANQKLESSWSTLVGNGTTGFDRIRASAKILLADGLEGLVNGLLSARDMFIDLYNNSLPLRAVLQTIFTGVKTSIELALLPAKEFWNVISGGAKILGAIVTGRLRDLPGIAKEVLGKAKDIAKKTGKNIGEDFKQGWENTLNGKIKLPVEEAGKEAIEKEKQTTLELSKLKADAAKKDAQSAAERAKKRQELNEKIAENEKKTSRLIIETEEEQDKVLREMENQFKEDLNKTLDDNSKAHSDLLKDTLSAYDAYYKEQSALLLENKGLFSNDKDERLAAEEELAARTLELQRELLQEKINSGLLEKDELTDAKMALFDVNKQIHDQEMANLEAESEKRKAITAQSIELAGQAFDVIGQFQDVAMSRLEARHERELASTEEGSEARIKAEAKYDVEKRKLQRKQAVLEKAQGLFSVGVNTAQAIMSALVEFPGPAGLVFSAIFGAMGAAQAAAILAKPLPAFKDGGIVGSDTWARVSEEGAELVRLPSGGTMLTPENESIMRLPRGAEVIPHDETMRLLAREAYVSANIEMGETNRILNKIHDKPSETVVNGVRYVNKKGLKGVYY